MVVISGDIAHSALDILLVDSTLPDAVHGELDAATLAWLEKTLAASPLLFLHHPSFDTGIVSSDGMRLLNADPLAALLSRHRRVLLVAAGPGPSRRADSCCGDLGHYFSPPPSRRSRSNSNCAGPRSLG